MSVLFKGVAPMAQADVDEDLATQMGIAVDGNGSAIDKQIALGDDEDEQSAHEKICAQWHKLHDDWRQNLERFPQQPVTNVPRYENDRTEITDYVVVARYRHIVLVYSHSGRQFTVFTLFGIDGRVCLEGDADEDYEDYTVQQYVGEDLYLETIIGWGYELLEGQRDQFRAAVEMYHERLKLFGFADPQLPRWTRPKISRYHAMDE